MKKILNIVFVVVLALTMAIVPTMIPTQTNRVAAAAPTVLVDNLQPSWTVLGGGGVYSAYIGPPPDAPHTYYDPGDTAVYLGREAGIIKAGLNADTDGNYTDEGLFGFRDNLGTINTLAAGTLTYDVVNQYGPNPVWMTIEIDTGVVGVRTDNTAFQHVPTTNPAGWHTVNAGAGQWLQWTNYTSGITTGPLLTLSQIASNASYTGLNMTRVYLRLGMGNSYHPDANGTVGWVDKITIGEVTYDFVLAKYWYVAKTGSDSNEGTLASPFLTIQKAVNSANVTENTIHVAEGNYSEGQILINKNLSIIGASPKPVINPTGNLTGTGVGKAWVLVNPGVTFTLHNVVLNGSTFFVSNAIRNHGSTTVDSVDFRNIQGSLSGSPYNGMAIVSFGGTIPGGMGSDTHSGGGTASNLTVTGCSFQQIGRIGVLVKGTASTAQISGCSYTGKGTGDFLDYGVEVGAGGQATITGNTITNCTNSTTAWASAGILVTDAYGPGSAANITGNTLTENEYGIAAGYNATDASVVTANFNSIYGNFLAIHSPSLVVMPDATCNWWGSASGPYHATSNPSGMGDIVSGNVDYSPWWGANYIGIAHPWNWYTNDFIQEAVDDASTGDTVNVAAGTYDEQVVITKSLTLLGTGDPVIQAPASPTKFKFPESAAWWDPVVFAFGGTNVGGTISGAGTVAVNVAGFTVDGNDRVPYDRAAGILFRNAGGNISDNTVQNMYIDGKQTLGILVYGDSDVVITGNDVSGYARGGIVANGDSITSPSYPTPHAVIEGNTVTGPGMGVPVTWAPNGIQIGYKATGKIIGNDVSANGWPGTEWTGSGIIVAGADSIEIYGNNVHGGQTGIAVCGYMWSPTGATAQGTWIHHNTVDGNTYGISIQDKSVNTTIEYNVVHNSSYDGIDICNFYGYAPTGTVIQHNSIIENNSEDDPSSGGVWIDAGIDGNEVAIHFNNIVDNNQYGINNTSTDNSVNATYNWWGSNSGPYHPTKNPGGTGDAVSDYVDFEPWLLVEPPTVTTQAATTITNTAATLNMNFTVGGYASVDVRFAYKKSSDSTWSYTSWASKSASGTHAASVAGLSSNTQYDFKAQLKYVDVEFGETTLDGATLQFTTLRTPGTVTTQAVTELSYFTAILNMGYTVGDFSPVQVRFAYKKADATGWLYTAWVSKSADGSHSEPRGLLQLGTTYQFKAQLEYDSTLIEGAILQFTTTAPPPWGAGGCFIATAAYGTPTAKEIDVLREFRDVVLLKSTVGSQFVSLYYWLSPPIANFIARHEAVRTLVRELLIDPIVWLVDTTGGPWQN